ncbi:MAG TPA: OmpA family protein [Myxococcota bacterium]|nr:OmpA family protein [Myxococcota bacterium]HOA12583.1 OmpA family protein [Myxococcota bacterium]HOC99979.1 OmpA family protein [Myxococcota bacterium]HOH76450.1 OmpA family protein [Myxococcota bacterium]
MKGIPSSGVVSFRLFLAGSLAACLLVASCVPQSQIRKRARDVSSLIGDQRESIYNCAPVELATAEINIEIARNESSLGRSVAAVRHMKLAEEAAEKAFAQSRDNVCLNDSDGDKVPDRKDRCPNQPEDVDGFQDADGCPDPDNDGDTVLDDQDECRDVPGPVMNKGCPIVDTDGDGLPDKEDRCPQVKGLIANFGCPIVDTDGDGLPDSEDRCPYETGLIANYGCPIADRDQDKVPDVEDACPDEPGPISTRGCPYRDTDGDGLLDPDDLCPMDPGPKDHKGCPYKRIEITEKKIELREKIFFVSGKSVIKRESWPLLNEIAKAMADHPAIKVDIEGHTDDVGNDRANMKLSQARANSVRAYLVKKGVEPMRMRAVGYGEDRPIDDNSTPEGQAINRRVEFVITAH